MKVTAPLPPLLAFSRVELLAVLAGAMLLSLVALPALARTRPRSDRVICANNLRQIGMGFQLWGNDHQDQPPWELPRVGPGGSSGGSGLNVNDWFHFASISNELTSARVLLCPSDSGRLAKDFSTSPDGGYLSPNFRNYATSYFLTHAFEGGQFAMFAGDRNFQTPNGVAGCTRFPQVTVASQLNLPGWDTNLHKEAGNIVRLDGRVNQYSNGELRAAVTKDPISDRGIQNDLHVLKPR
jgi:hypothetical protein